MKVIRILAVALMIVGVAGCGVTPQQTKISSIDPTSKEIVLLGSSAFDQKVRVALIKNGFKVKVQSSTRSITQKSEDQDSKFNLASARYGLVFSWKRVDYCLAGDGEKIILNAELIDLKTNEPVLFLTRSGWTAPCVGLGGELFDDLAKDLATNWN
jgi:hypothetical protein